MPPYKIVLVILSILGLFTYLRLLYDKSVGIKVEVIDFTISLVITFLAILGALLT